MFRKLVSNLSFSPSLISELGPYALRLKHEERARLIGLLLTTAAVGAQLFVSFNPPESANLASANDIIRGGIPSQEQLLSLYDQNEQGIRDIYNTLGITRTDISSARLGTVSPKRDGYVAGRNLQLGYIQGGRTVAYPKTASQNATIHLTPLNQLDMTAQARSNKTYDALIGESTQAGKFAIILSSGNAVISKLPTTEMSSCGLDKTAATAPPCQPCPSDSTVWVKNPNCQLPVVYAKTATNNTQNTIATSTSAAPSDRITYTLRAHNFGTQPLEVPFQDNIQDLLEYADISDLNGGTFDAKTATISWPDTLMQPDQIASYSFSMRIKPHIPATAQGAGNPQSYDCNIANTFGNTIIIPVRCPAPKLAEAVIADMPHTSAQINLIAGVTLLSGVLYFYLSARQKREELRLIRKNINSGTI